MAEVLIGLVGFVGGIGVGLCWAYVHVEWWIRRSSTFKAFEAHLDAWEVSHKEEQAS